MCKCKGPSLQGRHPHITGIWVWCKKIEMICMYPFDGWQSLCQILPLVPHWWGGGIPNVAVQWMSHPSSDPLSRSHLWNVDPVSLVLAGRMEEDDSSGPYSADGWQLFQPWHQMASDMTKGNESTSCTPGLTCSVSSVDDWQSFPHSALPSYTMDSGLPHWNGRVCLDGGYWLSPWPSGTLRGILDGRNSIPLAGF